MYVRIKQVMSIAYILLFILSSLDLGWLDLRVQAASNVIETTYDVNKTFTGLEHTHIWSFYYDDLYHWQQCDICGLVNNKHTHVLTENGGSKEYCMDNGDKAFRWVCTCGYSTKPLQVIHGRYYNYRDGNSYSRSSQVWLYNVLQITKADFNKWYGGKTHDGFEYTWYDYDGDGYGHVFCGGPVINRTKTKKGEYDSWGQQGTIAYIVGAEGDCAKNNPTDEYLALSMYLYYECNNNIDNCTRSGFVQYLKNKIYNKDGNPTAHALYGYDTKYANRVTDAQFKEILKEFKGTIPHPQGWGWQWSGLRCCRDNWKLHNDIGGGRTLCENETNYDNSVTNGDINNGHWTDMWDGVSVEADVSGAKYRGNEQYTDVNWPHINTASTAGTILGTSSRSEYYGKSISQLPSGTTTEWLYFADRLGKNKKVLAKYYYQYKRVGHHYYVRYRAICENGGYVYRVTSRHITSNPGDSVSWTGYVDENKKGTDVTTEWLEIPTTNANRQAAWADTAYMYIRDTIDGPYIPERQTSNPEGYLDNYSQLRYYYPLIDDTAPKSYNTSTWKIKYGDNGAWENISTNERSTAATLATLKVQFSDLMQFDENLVYVHIYDNDKKTIMKQFVVGQEWVPCERITTFNDGDTDFDSQVWQATLQIQTEVVGKHQIYVQAKDSRGNLSELIPVTVSNIDSKGPSVSVTNLNNINTWSKTKSYNITAQDATAKFEIGLGLEDMRAGTKDTVRKYTFTGDVSLTATKKGKSFAIWGRDTAGNVSFETLDLLSKQVRYLDNTAPTLTVKAEDYGLTTGKAHITITADDYCSTIREQGSGGKADGAGKYGYYYGYSRTNDVNTATWSSLETSTKHIYDLIDSGNYYFWVKDYVGNISAVKSLYIDKFTLNLAKDSVINHDAKSYTHFVFSETATIQFPASEIDTERTDYNYTVVLENNKNSKLTYEGITVTSEDFAPIKEQIEGKERSTISFGRTFLGWFTENNRDSVAIGKSKTYVNVTPNRNVLNNYTVRGNKTSATINTTTYSTTLYPLWQDGVFVLPNCVRNNEEDIFYGWFTVPQIGNTSPIANGEFVGEAGDVIQIDKNITLYPWFNSKPIFVDMYEGLFFEGQDVSIADLRKLVGVFDYDDDYSDLATEYIESLPTVDENALYLPVLSDYESEDDFDVDKEYDLTDILETIQVENYAFDSTRWEPVDSSEWEQQADNEYWEEVETENLVTTDHPIYIRDGKLYTPNHPEGIDGVYRYIGEDEAQKGNIYYTDTAKAELASYVNNPEYTKLQLKVKSITYKVKDNSETEEVWTVPTTDISDYDKEKAATDELSAYTNNSFVGRKGINHKYIESQYRLDTSSSRLLHNSEDEREWYGDFDVTYAVTDNGLLLNGVILTGSPITISYTRGCRLRYNQLPIIYLMNLIDFTDTTYDSYETFKNSILDAQTVLDGEDTRANLPWWTRKKTAPNLLDTLEIVGVKNVEVDYTLCAKYNLDGDTVKATLNEDMANKGTSALEYLYSHYKNGGATENKMWQSISSFDIVVDAHDQWGKYASGKVLSNYPYGVETIEGTPLLYQDELYRTISIILVNAEDSLDKNNANIMKRVRFINENYLDSVSSKNSYWGAGDGKTLLESIMEKRNSTGLTNSYQMPEGGIQYTNPLGTEVNIIIEDYSN